MIVRMALAFVLSGVADLALAVQPCQDIEGC
jgi:hypothetical protein